MKMNYLAFLLFGCWAITADAATLTTLDSFNSADGSNPQADLAGLRRRWAQPPASPVT